MLDPRLVARIDGIEAQIGRPLAVFKGKVNRAQAEKDYAAYQDGTGPLAPKPEASPHVQGIAIDVPPEEYTVLEQYADEYNLVRPREEEPWHWELDVENLNG